MHPHFQLYKEVSLQVRDIFYQVTDEVEPMSLDEAYLDVTENKMQEPDPVKLAMWIKDEVQRRTRLTCSAGVSYNKFLAKIGSDLNKPDGLTVINEDNAQEILFALPIRKFHGIGQVTAARMKKMGIHNGEDLHKRKLAELMRIFGKAGYFYYNVVRGIDTREVTRSWDPKSISCENTFPEDVGDLEDLLDYLRKLADRLSERMMKKKIQGKSLVLKLKYDNFENITRSMSLPYLTADGDILYQYGKQLLVTNWDSERKLRLLGLGVSKLDCDADYGQIELDL